MNGVTYDAGALIAIDRGDVAAAALHMRYLQRSIVPVVPAGMLAQVWREPARQVRLGIALRGCRVEALDEQRSKQIGELARLTGQSDVVDLSVAEGVLRRRDLVHTSDPDDLLRCGVPKGAIRRA